MACWLMKSEPESYSIDDLAREGTGCWDGVRNYQARNLMRDEMRPGDRVLFYHSNAKPSGVAGVAEVVRAGYPDHTSWDPESPYHDPKSTPEAPRWFMVDVAFRRKLPRVVALAEIKRCPELAHLPLVNRSRLSVQPVDDEAFARIVAMAERAPES